MSWGDEQHKRNGGWERANELAKGTDRINDVYSKILTEGYQVRILGSGLELSDLFGSIHYFKL